jgi:hypothetical protein
MITMVSLFLSLSWLFFLKLTLALVFPIFLHFYFYISAYFWNGSIYVHSVSIYRVYLVWG